jgi:ATP-dependent helicase IRC3
MSFKPRNYQKAAVCSVIEGYRSGKRQLLLRLPTGAGKTVISALIIEELLGLLGQQRILFLAHRREIIDQTAETIARQIGAQRVSIEQAERKAEAAAQVVVASVQTLAGRLDEYPAAGFGALIVDECHHAYAKTWMDVISHFGSCAQTLLLGLTATPRRSDGRCVGELFRETAFEISLGELQEQGYLVPMAYYTIEASLGLGSLSLDASGEFQASFLAKIMNSSEVRELTVRACLEKAQGQKTIAFCASVEHAKDLAGDFAARGIPSAFISGETPDRSQLIEQFRSGTLRFLSNFGVLTEGFDDPSIECVLLARPTTSPLVYSQCLGRGLRSHPGKRVCTVIDIVDRQRQQLQYNAFEAAGLKRSWRGSGKDPLREAAAIARIRVADPSAFLRLRHALSLHETQEILMGLDPRLVFAGIDGMPMVRYERLEKGAVLDAVPCEELAAKIAREAGIASAEIRLHDGLLTLTLTDGTDVQTSPYLAWHLEQATGWNIQIVQAPQVMPEISAPLPSPEPLEQEHVAPAEPQREFEYVREDWSSSSDDIGWDQQADDIDHPAAESSAAPPSKRTLGLRDRLERLVQESRELAPHTPFEQDFIEEIFVSTEDPLPQNSQKDKRRLSIQERMRAMKTESMRNSSS